MPKTLREQYDLHPGDDVVFEKREDAIVIRKAPAQPTGREDDLGARAEGGRYS